MEESRHQLRCRWLEETDRAEWTPKCDVFLYSTSNSFQQHTRRPAEMWGFADLEIGEGRVWMRRLDCRADDTARLERVLVHELTHVILADRFCSQRIPRWADEGIAVLSEPQQRQRALRTWLTDEVAAARHWPLKTLLSASEYPADARQIELMYAQSGSWVEFLLTERRHSEPDVIRFIEATQRRPLSEAVSESFPDESLETLQAAWVNWLRAPTP